MSRELIEILILAAIAGVVVARLYAVLGRRTGSERPTAAPQAQPAPVERAPVGPAPAPQSAGAPSAPVLVGGLGEIQARDPSFEPAHFLSGARAAYEMIVQAFAAGDRQTLQGLLTPRVYAAYDGAISQRETGGGAGPELVRLKSADIADASLHGDLAKVAVRFEAELAEGVSGVRDTRERWTFERALGSRDPTWLLSAVAQA